MLADTSEFTLEKSFQGDKILRESRQNAVQQTGRRHSR
jgi:hypothetical protein